MKIGSKLIQLV